MKIFNIFVLALTVLCNLNSFGGDINSNHPSYYDSLNIVEKVYIHTDRVSYFPGVFLPALP
jgi:hypothetical protein